MSGEGSQRRLGEQTFPPHSPPARDQRAKGLVDGAMQVHVPGNRADGLGWRTDLEGQMEDRQFRKEGKSRSHASCYSRFEICVSVP